MKEKDIFNNINWLKIRNFSLLLIRGIKRLAKHLLKTSVIMSIKHASSNVSINIASFPLSKQSKTFGKCGESTLKLSSDLKNELFFSLKNNRNFLI